VPISPIWTVNGGFVAAEGDTGTIVCPFVLLPCLSYTLKSMHLNATQRDGQQVILVTDFQQSDTGLPLLITDFHETYDNSSPAPIPSGQAAPAPSAAMADLLGGSAESPGGSDAALHAVHPCDRCGAGGGLVQPDYRSSDEVDS
jgi:hypothetical protein